MQFIIYLNLDSIVWRRRIVCIWKTLFLEKCSKAAQLTFTCWKSTIERRVTMKTLEQRQWRYFAPFSSVDFEQVNVNWSVLLCKLASTSIFIELNLYWISLLNLFWSFWSANIKSITFLNCVEKWMNFCININYLTFLNFCLKLF